MPSCKEGCMVWKSSCTLNPPWDAEPGSAPSVPRSRWDNTQPLQRTLSLGSNEDKVQQDKTDTKHLPKKLLEAQDFSTAHFYHSFHHIQPSPRAEETSLTTSKGIMSPPGSTSALSGHLSINCPFPWRYQGSVRSARTSLAVPSRKGPSPMSQGGHFMERHSEFRRSALCCAQDNLLHRAFPWGAVHQVLF